MAKQYGLSAGIAMDLMTGYDFNRTEDRRRNWNHVKQQKPLILIGSPSCREFSILQYMNTGKSHARDQEIIRSHKRAVKHHEFCMLLYYREQMQQGRYFVHEQPAAASSWSLYCTREVG